MRELLRRAAFRLSLSAWRLRVPLIARRAALPEILARVAPPPGAPFAGLPAGWILRRVRTSCRRPWLMRDRRCLREGLLAWRFLLAAGYRPRLHFGVDRTSVGQPRLAAHCWLSLDGEVVLNPPLPSHVEVQVVEPEAAHGLSRSAGTGGRRAA